MWLIIKIYVSGTKKRKQLVGEMPRNIRRKCSSQTEYLIKGSEVFFGTGAADKQWGKSNKTSNNSMAAAKTQRIGIIVIDTPSFLKIETERRGGEEEEREKKVKRRSEIRKERRNIEGRGKRCERRRERGDERIETRRERGEARIETRERRGRKEEEGEK